MKNQAKYICFAIIASQVICITVGLCIHGRLVTSLVQSEARTKGIAFDSAALSRLLLAAGGITLFWISALLAPIVYMLLSRFHNMFSREYKRSQDEGIKRAQALVRTRDAVIFGLAKLADSRDPETGAHLERITCYSSLLAAALRRYPKYRDMITPSFARLIEVSTALHDIGKVGIEDAILLKRGPLTDAERAKMQSHSTIGGQCLKKIEQCLGSSNFLHMAREIAFCHHERWDGAGYPAGLSAEEIPLSARIVAVADVYDALSSRRVYKPPLPHEKCVEIIRNEAGKQFDPGLVDAFLKVQSRFRDIARQYSADTFQRPADKPDENIETLGQKLGEPVSAGVGGDDRQGLPVSVSQQ